MFNAFVSHLTGGRFGSPQQEPIQQAISAGWKGDVSGALAQSLPIANDPTNPSQNDALTLSSVLSFTSASTSGDLDASVALMLKQYSNPTASASTKAWAIDHMIDVMKQSNDKSVYRMVFDYPDFQSLEVATSTLFSIRNLAQKSVSTFDTSEAEQQLAAYRAARIVTLNTSYATNPATPQALANDTAQMQADIAKSDSLFSTERANVNSTSIGITLVPWHDLNNAAIYAAVAQYDVSFQSQAETQFENVFGYGNQWMGQYPLVVQPVAAAHLTYAIMLYRVSPKAGVDGIESNLKAFVDLVGKNPSLLQNQLLYFSSLAHVPAAGQGVYPALAKISPEFKSFLQAQGWKM